MTFTLTEDVASLFIGYASKDKGKSTTKMLNTGSTLSAGRDMYITAGEDINVVGSTLTAKRDMGLDAGDDINILEGRTTENVRNWQQQLQIGFYAEAKQSVSKSLRELDIYLKDLNDNTEKIKRGDDGVNFAAGAVQQGAKLGQIMNPSASARVGLITKTAYSQDEKDTNTAIGSALSAGRDMVLNAGDDIHIRGSDLTADNNLLLTADNVYIESSQNLSTSSSWKQDMEFFVGLQAKASAGKGWEPPAGLNFSAGYGTSQEHTDAVLRRTPISPPAASWVFRAAIIRPLPVPGLSATK